MATLASAAAVKTACNLPSLPDAGVTPWLVPAQERVLAFIGQTVYDAVQDTESEVYAAADLARVTRGECLLAGALAVLAAGTVTSGQGLMAVAGGMQGGGTRTLSQREVAVIANRLEAQAWEALGPYRRDYLAAQDAAGTRDTLAGRAAGMRFRSSQGVQS